MIFNHSLSGKQFPFFILKRCVHSLVLSYVNTLYSDLTHPYCPFPFRNHFQPSPTLLPLLSKTCYCFCQRLASIIKNKIFTLYRLASFFQRLQSITKSVRNGNPFMASLERPCDLIYGQPLLGLVVYCA